MRYLFIVLGYIFTFSILNTATASTNNTLFVIEHRNEFTLFLCVITLILGTWLGVKLPNQNKEMTLEMKLASGLFGGILAFIYCLHRDKGLTLLNPIWVGVSSVCLPATIIIIISKIRTWVEKYEVGK